jgi:NAD-dependent SIR2 family protein deacetylase
MKKGHHLHFQCVHCQHPVQFSLFEIEGKDEPLSCEKCHKRYALNDETLQRQLGKFEALCRQIVESEEILSNTSVGIDVEGHQVAIPYKLLLTRLTSQLKLLIGGQQIAISFRMEPLKDLPERI